MLLLLSLPTALAAPISTCERTYATTDLTDALDSTEMNFAKQDADSFAFSEKAVSARLECFGEPLAPDVLARVYLTEALKAFLDSDDPRLAAALAGMAAASPGYQIPLKLVPDGHPVRKAMGPAGLLLRDPVVVPLLQTETGWIEVDGVHRTEAVNNRDVILQRFGGDGQVAETLYVRAGESLEGWQSVAPPVSGKPPAPPVATKPATPPTPLPLAAHRPFAVRASLGVVGGGSGAAEVITGNPPGFGGPGGRAAVGLELGAGRIGGFAEVGWLGVFNPASDDGYLGSSHGVLVAGGVQLRIGTVTVEAGPAWSVSAVHLEGVDCAASGCGGLTGEGVASVDGLLTAGGGVLGADVRLGGAESILALEVEGGAVTDLARASYWGGAGLRFGNRWAGP